ncbi:MAG: DNA polymerase III subunit chi [Acinetobacter sp.]|uniref:DNA polymerase III subunit chi n=1 Tax=Acinetobacter sp. TaxID=472 RepID=UPI003D055658
MAKVSFYLFEKSPERQVESACRLCRKILRQPERIWLYCADAALQQQLDERLWSFDATGFIPHGIDQNDATVCISAQLPEQSDWIVFNFNQAALDQYANFRHIIEIIENNEAAKIIGREKYKQYRRLGIQPQTHKL